MKLKGCLCILTSFFATTIVQAQQPVDGIVPLIFDAIGGHDKIAQINSLYIEGNMEVMGTQSPTTITILNGKGYKK
jgi:hypothetical protein